MMRDIILNLLHNLGGQREVERYLREYTQPGAERIIVVKVGGALIEEELDALASSLAFLKHIGMSPVIVHGAGPQLSRRLDEQGVACTWIDGLRVTTPEVLAAAHEVFGEAGETLARSIDAHGVRAKLITTGVFQAQLDNQQDLGLVGKVVGVQTGQVISALKAGYIPVLSPLGMTGDGQLLNINADTATRAICEKMQPGKILFLTQTGGIIGADGELIPAVNLIEDRQRLVESGQVSGGMARKMFEIEELLNELPPSTSVSISAPAHIARELFTHKGSGTLIRLGATIESHDSIDALDRTELKNLLESSFGKALHTRYFDELEQTQILIAPYTAAAIVVPTDHGSYLDKFAVNARAQGAGIGASLWSKLTEQHPKLFWRSHANNPINAWYMSHADGMVRADQWMIFWRGLGSRDEIANAVGYARSLEPSFIESVSKQEVGVG